MTSNPIVRKVTFTGSTEVGKHADGAERADRQEARRWSSAAMRPSSYSTMPISMPRSKARWRRNTAMPARPASAPTAFSCRTAIYDMFVARCRRRSADQGRQRFRTRRHDRSADRRWPAMEKVEEHVADALSKGAHVSWWAASAMRSAAHSSSRPCWRTSRPDMMIFARGNLRPGCAGVPLQDRRRGDRACERYRVRPCRPISTPAISGASGASPKRSSTAWSASTTA